MQQQELDFTAPPSPAPGEVEILTAYLQQNPGFHTARQLAHALAYTDRQIRQFAELSDGSIISGPGSPGYCHITHCDPETIGHIADTLRSQARRMIARSIRIRNRAHKLIR